MEFEKNFKNFSFGYGSATTAGKGNLKDSVPVKSTIKDKAHRKNIIKTIAKGSVAVILFFLNRKGKKKK